MQAKSVHTERIEHYRAIRRFRNAGLVIDRSWLVYGKQGSYAYRTPVSARKGLSLRGTSEGSPTTHKARKPVLTPVQRDTLKLLVDYDRRAAWSSVTRAVLAQRDAELDGTSHNGLSELRGIPAVVTREARHSERGASGIKGVRGSFQSVSMRDSKTMGKDGQHDSLLGQLSTVGVATHPLAREWHYSAAILECRKDWHKSTVRITNRRVPFAVWAKGLHTSIVPVTDYLVLRDTRKQGKRKAVAVQASRQAQDMALQASIGTIHEAL